MRLTSNTPELGNHGKPREDPLILLQVADLQVALKEEQIIVEEKKAATQALIESIGKEKAIADEAVEASRADEEAAAALQATLPSWPDAFAGAKHACMRAAKSTATVLLKVYVQFCYACSDVWSSLRQIAGSAGGCDIVPG